MYPSFWDSDPIELTEEQKEYLAQKKALRRNNIAKNIAVTYIIVAFAIIALAVIFG